MRSPDRPAFRRQHPIGPCIHDFYCAMASLAVEVGGRAHEAADRPERDARRDAWLQAQGIEVLRIPARDILRGADAVADGVLRTAQAMIEGAAPSAVLPHGPRPPLRGGA